MGREILHAVDIAADAETVYGAITTHEGESGFWTSNNDIEPAEGSVARFGFPQAPVDLKVRVDRLEPGRHVAWTPAADWVPWQGTTITWDLDPAPEGAGTRVMFRHVGWADDYPEDQFASVNWVWGQVLGRLKGYAETGRAQPFFG